MTSVVVHDETGKQPELVQNIHEIVHDHANKIAEVTGLHTPDYTFRLLTPATWRAQHRHDLAAATGLTYPPEAAEEARKTRKERRALWLRVAMTWPLRADVTVLRDGIPQTFLCPRGMHHAGTLHNWPALRRLVIHGCIHQAQMETSRCTVAPIPAWTADTPHSAVVQALTEAHADWADHQVCGPPDASSRATQFGSWCMTAVDLFAAKEAGRGMTPPPPERPVTERPAYRFVARVIDEAGPDAFNRIWRDLHAVPTFDEVFAPDEWLRRVSA